MFKAAINYLTSFIPVKAETTSVSDEAVKMWRDLVKSDFESSLLHNFANKILAQDIPDKAFEVLISRGSGEIVSYFFETDPSRGDCLSDEKVKAILNTPGLRFIDNRRYVACDELEYRALKLLTGFAALEPAALISLMVSPRCALVALALWRNCIATDPVLLQVVATVGNFQSRDLRLFLENPEGFRVEDSYSLKETDLILIETIRKNPASVYDILFLEEVA